MGAIATIPVKWIWSIWPDGSDVITVQCVAIWRQGFDVQSVDLRTWVFRRRLIDVVRQRNIPLRLAVKDFPIEDCRYQHGPESKHPVYKMRLSARDLARIGLLYLRNGCWPGLLPS